MNSYFVCVTISRRYISFEFHQEGASKPLAPFPADETWPVPLALYCTSSKIEIGQAAERAATRGVTGAFKEWFKHLSTGETLSYLGQQQPVSHLLLLAAEEQFRKFLKDVRYNMDGGLENCRSSMPIILNFEDDVDDSMRIFLVNLFKNMGYGRVYEIYHNRCIAAYYGSVCPTDHILIVDSDGVDLILSLYMRGREEAKFKQVILNAGVDPRVQSICNMIWDKTGAEYSFLERSSEQSALELIAAEVIKANQIEFEGSMHYSNGESLSFLISRSELVASGAGSRSISSEIAGMLRNIAGLKPNDVTVLLRNFASSSDYFSQTLGVDFPSLIRYEQEGIEASNGIIVSQIMPRLTIREEASPSIPEPLALHTCLNSTIQKHENQNAADNSVSSSPSQEEKPLDQKAMMKMGREMRAVRANINAKFSRGDRREASIAYKELLASWGDNAPENLLTKLHEWLESKGITREDLLTAANQTKPSSPPKRQIPDPEIRKRRKKPKSAGDIEEKNEVAEGERLLKLGNFSEAKRFFAGIGNEHMKQLCIDLLRDSRDLKAIACQNPSSLSPTARKNNLDKLKRILTNYRKAMLGTDSIEELIRKYK